MLKISEVVSINSYCHISRITSGRLLGHFSKLFSSVAVYVRSWMTPSAKTLSFVHEHPWFFRWVAPKLMYPKGLLLSMTSKCNLQCKFCPREGVENVDFDMKLGIDFPIEDLEKLDKAIQHAEYIDLTGFGEPFFYPHFDELLRYIYSRNTRSNLIRVTTNGTALTRKTAKLLGGKINRIYISLNAANPESYRTYMQYDFTKTVARIEDFMSELGEADTQKVFLHFIAHRYNLEELPEFVLLAKKLGVQNVGFYNWQIVYKEHLEYSLLHAKKSTTLPLIKRMLLEPVTEFR